MTDTHQALVVLEMNMISRRQFLKTVTTAAATVSLDAVVDSPRATAADAGDPIRIDFHTPNGRFRPLHGLNKGPLAAGGLVDVIAAHRELGVPLTRLHDCHWPVPDVVDMHVVFPNPTADPSLPESYDFALTDEYIQAIRDTGSEILYRLGETIEHTTVRKFVHPPKDPDRWAAAALGIIRHYNEGWAGGFRYGIRRWEIWNEPETRPAMWTGTDAEFFHLYSTAARAIKAAFPDLLVGGPGVGITGDLVDGDLRPSIILKGFLDKCLRDSLPLDFLSWHCYSADPKELPLRARCIRELLDRYGFTRTQSYLDEWRHIPDYNWAPLSRTADPLVRQKWYERMTGPESAAFIAAVLLGLQDVRVDAANFFHGELGGFGMFDESGVPWKNYYGMLAFRRLLDTPVRASVTGPVPQGVTIGAGRVQGGAPDKDSAGILISHYAGPPTNLQLKLDGLPWPNSVLQEVRLVDSQHNLTPVADLAHLAPGSLLSLSLQAPSVALIPLAPGA